MTATEARIKSKKAIQRNESAIDRQKREKEEAKIKGIRTFRKTSLFERYVEIINKEIEAQVNRGYHNDEILSMHSYKQEEMGLELQNEPNRGHALAEHYNKLGYEAKFYHTRYGFATDGSDTFWELSISWRNK